MKRKSFESCGVILILYPDIIFLNTTLNKNVFLKALSYSSGLKISRFNVDTNFYELGKIILHDSDNNLITVYRHNVLVEENNVLKAYDDPGQKLFGYLVKELAKDYYDEIKYFIETEKNVSFDL